MKRILVTGAGGSAAINFIASLRMAPEEIYIVGTDTNKWHLELPNVNKRYILTLATNENYIEKLIQVIDKEGIEFIHPQPDPEVKVISENRERIQARTYLPRKETIKTCQDKARLSKLLMEHRVSVPESIAVNSPEDLDRALNTLEKGNGKIWLRARKGAGSRASLPISEKVHGEMWIDYWAKVKGIGWGDFMACEFLPGKEFAFQSLWNEGELITSAARERLEYIFGNLTPSGQSSSPSVAKTIHREDVNEVATRAVLAVDESATGIFCIDMKENKDGNPCVTEINAGRFFTTSNFFAELGVNMPYIYVKLAYGEEISNLPKYNAAPKDCYWIRLVDKGPILVRGEEWRSMAL